MWEKQASNKQYLKFLMDGKMYQTCKRIESDKLTLLSLVLVYNGLKRLYYKERRNHWGTKLVRRISFSPRQEFTKASQDVMCWGPKRLRLSTEQAAILSIQRKPLSS